FTETDLPLIEDYFQYNNFHHYISYRLGLELRADAKKRDQEKAHEALNKTIHQMFNHVDKMKTLKAFASPTLTTDFVSLYLDHLDRKNVNQGSYQIDLEFIPRNHPSVLFDREARAVALWDLNQRSS